VRHKSGEGPSFGDRGSDLFLDFDRPRRWCDEPPLESVGWMSLGGGGERRGDEGLITWRQEREAREKDKERSRHRYRAMKERPGEN
jgi:hypothetical protein